MNKYISLVIVVAILSFMILPAGSHSALPVHVLSHLSVQADGSPTPTDISAPTDTTTPTTTPTDITNITYIINNITNDITNVITNITNNITVVSTNIGNDIGSNINVNTTGCADVVCPTIPSITIPQPPFPSGIPVPSETTTPTPTTTETPTPTPTTIPTQPGSGQTPPQSVLGASTQSQEMIPFAETSGINLLPIILGAIGLLLGIVFLAISGKSEDVLG